MTVQSKSRRLRVSDVNVVDHPTLKKALGGTIVGNTMEWYDVGVFGYLITTMGPVFLPEADKAVQNLFLLGTFGATFIARPLGGVFFGWLGDKIGRQKVLAMTLMLMAAATFAVGLLPGYAVLGIWAAVLLVVTKLVQGFSTGGEYAGATTFVCEHSPDHRRGFFVSFLDMGSYLGFALGAALVSVLQLTLGQDQMEAWGWRIPFLIAGPLGIIAIYFRMKIEESPAFQATLEAEEESARHPETGEVLGADGPGGDLQGLLAQDRAGHDPRGGRQHGGLRPHVLHAHIPDQQQGVRRDPRDAADHPRPGGHVPVHPADRASLGPDRAPSRALDRGRQHGGAGDSRVPSDLARELSRQRSPASRWSPSPLRFTWPTSRRRCRRCSRQPTATGPWALPTTSPSPSSAARRRSSLPPSSR